MPSRVQQLQDDYTALAAKLATSKANEDAATLAAKNAADALSATKQQLADANLKVDALTTQNGTLAKSNDALNTLNQQLTADAIPDALLQSFTALASAEVPI